MTVERQNRPRRALSIALRMTLWYAFFTFTLILAAAGILYWTLVKSMYQEDLRDLADNLNNARLLLRTAPHGWVTGTDERLSWAPPQQPQIYLRLLNSDGRPLTETAGMADELPPPSPAELATIGIPVGEDVKHEVVSHSGKPFVSMVARVQGPTSSARPQFIQVAMDRTHDESLLERYRERLWFVVGLSMVLCSLAGYLIARDGMRPIQEISRTAAHIRPTTLHERIATQGLPAELGVLAETFNSMLERLEHSFRHVSQFSDDVAHELRTPLNNLRGEIEVALSKPRSADHYRETLASCFEECTRIASLVQTLLFLARSDTTEPALQREEIDVGAELTTVEAFYGAAAADAGVTLRAAGGVGLRAQLNRTLFQQAVGNLVSNAIAHTPPGGSVAITACSQDRRLTVAVTDTGCGIAADHLPRVFDRFYRVDRARTGSAQHVGLGLAVVKSIAARHGGQVEIESELGRGTEVRLLLPL